MSPAAAQQSGMAASDQQGATPYANGAKAGIAVAFSAGIRAIKHIDVLLNVEAVMTPRAALRENHDLRCVLVWGRKQNAKHAIEFASRHSLPVWYIEDGWIRSSARNAHSRRCYSLLIDREGVYYDSTKPSELENYLNRDDQQFSQNCGPAELAYSQACQARMVKYGISKYNFCRAASDESLNKCADKPLVLVVDQTCDDASVRYGGLQADDFRNMLDAAIDENPDARVVVRTHPDVVIGRRKGYLSEYAAKLGVEISAEGDNPIQWLNKASCVYVGTSQLGFEALMCGCKVVVAGKPFYSGWGLTDDRQTIERRTQSRTFDQLFHATHVYLARYCNPITAQPWQLDECLDHVIEQKRQFTLNAHRFVCVGITGWKKRYLAQYLRSPDGDVRFSDKNDAEADERAVCWSFRQPRTKDLHFTRIEDGFLRSQGLGSDFIAPGSLVIDSAGLYFDPAAPSDLENLLNEYDCSLDETLRAARLRKRILDAGISKYNVGDSAAVNQWSQQKLEGQQIVLVVGQVEDDQSIKKGCADVTSNSDLCRIVRKRRPNAFIVYKPHPDVESGNRRGMVDRSVSSECVDHVEPNLHIADCLNACSELHTMTSLSGFEGLMRQKPVFTYGMPFYAGWGLTHDHLVCERRNRTRTLDELVFLSLIAYPRYLDVSSGEFVTAEQQVEQLIAATQPEKVNVNRFRWARKLRNVGSALMYKP
ncbi:MAG: capsular polysaccharide biosynthesis protein [Granulosicoccus sp.]